jgi:hypothetical protein
MNTFVLSADRATHLRIVAIALLVATLVVLVSLLARGSAAPFMMQVVVKASSIAGHASITLSVLPELIARVR